MSPPKTVAQIKQRCIEMGLDDVQIFPGAATADRPGDFNPRGGTNHITAGGLGKRTEEQYIRDIINGDPNVPLKANAVTAPDGTLWLNAQGNTNHCLYFSEKGRQATYNGTWSLDNSVNYRGSKTKWSPEVYGMEVIAATKMNRVQYAVMICWNAAISTLHGWTGQEFHGHGEIAYDRGFGDPNENMGVVRRETMQLVSWWNAGNKKAVREWVRSRVGLPLDGGATGGSGSKPLSPTTTTGGEVVENFKEGRAEKRTLKGGQWNSYPLCKGSDLIWAWNDQVFINGGVYLNIDVNDPDAYVVSQFYAIDSSKPKFEDPTNPNKVTGYERAYTWEPVASDRMNEIFVPLSTMVWGPHKLGINIFPSKDMLINRSRTEFNVFRNK